MEQLATGSKIYIRPSSTLKSPEKLYKPKQFNGSSVTALRKPKNGLTKQTAADLSFGFQKAGSLPHPTPGSLNKPLRTRAVRLNRIAAQSTIMNQTQKRVGFNGFINGITPHHTLMDQAKKQGNLNGGVSRIPTKAAPTVTRNKPSTKQASSRVKTENGLIKRPVPNTHSSTSPTTKSQIPTRTAKPVQPKNQNVGFGTTINKPYKIADDATTAETCLKFNLFRRTFAYPEKSETSSANPKPKIKNEYKGTIPDFETRQNKTKKGRETHKNNEGYTSWTELQKKYQKSLRS